MKCSLPKITKIIIATLFIVLVLSVVLSLVSLYPGGNSQPLSLNSDFTLTPNETYMEGLGAFHGGEKITFWVTSSAYPLEFSLDYPSQPNIITTNTVAFSKLLGTNINETIVASPVYYQAVFVSSSSVASNVTFHVSVQQPTVDHPYSWLNESAKILFFGSLVVLMLVILRNLLLTPAKGASSNLSMPSLSKRNCRILLILLLVSMVIWFTLLIFNSNPLATFENWYTDNARDSYVSSLFLKDGFAVFSQPLGKLANVDNSRYKFVTWPEMPHLYPLGSIFLFLPFGILLQNGFNATIVYKIEIAIFLIFATAGVYFFLKYYMQKDMALILRLFGVYIIYVSLVVYASDGMFDSVAFLFSLFAILMFLTERYDYFFLLVAVSVFFKYQAGIFLFPLIVVGILRLFQTNTLSSLVRNKAVIGGTVLSCASLFTAYLSAPYFMASDPQLVTGGTDIFAPGMQVAWSLQTFSVLLTLAVVLSYSVYMFNRNSLLSLSALFLLIPSFLLPYFQNWYMPFVFVYALIPQRKNELEATTLLLVFLVVVLAISGSSYQPIPEFAQFLQPHIPLLHSPFPHLPLALERYDFSSH